MPATAMKKNRNRGPRAGQPDRPMLTAATADHHTLYQLSVQNVEAEIDFIDERYELIRGRKASTLREDFGGTGNTACEWVRRRDANSAVALDIDQPTIDWGMAHNVAQLGDAQKQRVRLINRDVRAPGDATGFDIVLAMNFSYWLFKTRDALRAYFKSVHDSLADDGVFFCDHFGGYEAFMETKEKRKITADDSPVGPFTYIWHQEKYNPITGDMRCNIHFRFPDRTRLDNAFTYEWRLWTLPETRELLEEAGFKNVTVYWEGDEIDDDGEETGEGNGEFEPTTQGEADPAFVCYISAEK